MSGATISQVCNRTKRSRRSSKFISDRRERKGPETPSLRRGQGKHSTCLDESGIERQTLGFDNSNFVSGGGRNVGEKRDSD